MTLRKPLLLLAMGCCIFSGCRRDYHRDEGMVWHTTYHITYDSPRDLRDSVIATFRDVDASLNVFDAGSLVSKANEQDSILTDIHFRRVYEMSRHINELSDGAFDPTLGPLITAWGFGKGHKATADTLRLDSLLAITGISKTHLSGNRLIKDDRRISFNFSAIAKGYGSDAVAATLERNGVENYLVEIGGEIRCKGKSPSGKQWRVSIDRPVRSDKITHDSQCVVELTDAGLATSGNYRNFNEASGANAGHTISSTTGRPVTTDILSATVIAPTAMEADALATAMMAAGSEGARKMARATGYRVLLVLSDMSVWQQGFPSAE
ncbi:MAG: FAD:protein FMN transferase [Muribaculaceae bacterium]|nr:FAD:protein FMN transferase [Muribaculaceae bacterium]